MINIAQNSQARILQNKNDKLTINRLPVEIFSKIILSTYERPCVATPYPFMVFSWDNMQLLQRSRDAPLEIIAQCGKLFEVYTRDLRSSTVANRVKTFHLIHVCLDAPNFDPCPKFSTGLLSSFPSLEHVLCSGLAESSCIPLNIQPQLKAMQVSIYRLGNFAIPGFFRELRWLILTYRADIMSLRSLLEALKNLPNLQSLQLVGLLHPLFGAEIGDLEPITLNELTVLISNCPLLHIINAPKLSYLQVEIDTILYSEHSHPFIDKTYGHLCGFDFSKITRIRSEITHRRIKPNPYITGNSTYGRQDVDNDFWPLSKLYCHGRSFNLNESLSSYYPDQFRLSFGERWELIPTFILYLDKCINIVEIVFTAFDLSSLTHAEATFFTNALRSATTVRNVTIISGDSLKEVCNFLSDGNLLPGLERLNYSASDHEKDTNNWGYIFNCVSTLLTNRLETSLMPLKIELGNFRPFQAQEFEQIKVLGLGVIQKEGILEIMADPKRTEVISLICTYLGI
ncbi:hypothetical protein Clacol_008726 [Clathrus columnatus]|uniref:F-box domain-containing protein n=1 Tax=Clathrus columnatus TaxID=1419009 RepID=A0AAV5AII8_9AGAM|nr:hypothetical protein Clacol_008726 [Clathrus columnatus]